MPNWKKVIVSGSDASLNSLNVSTYVSASTFNGKFTGSLQGSSSFASTASFVNPLNQTVSINGGLTVTATTGTDYVQHLISLKRAFFKPFYEARASGILQGLKQGGFLN